MKSKKTKRWFGILLATLLLIQLSYHTIHVFSSHASDSHIENTSQNSQVENAGYSCDLCAKLLGNTFFLWILTMVFHVVAVSALNKIEVTRIYSPGPKLACLLRGPPTPSY